MNDKSYGTRVIFYSLLFTVCCLLFSCGYRLVGSRLLPFDTITIKPVQNKTYEPHLEEKLHHALSNEFIKQGIGVVNSDGDVKLETTVTELLLGAIGSVDETVKEQELIMRVDIRLVEENRIREIRAMESPLKITFQSTGTVSQVAAEKDRAIEKASAEIANEIVSRILIEYAK